MAITENIIFLLLQSISGAASGYVTNKYAVNMLFKEYTPLKIGGAIRKNKNKFIEEISDLVERDIINGETLKDKINSNEFKESINALIETFVSEQLVNRYNDIPLCESAAFDDSCSSLRKFTKESLSNTAENVINDLLNNINKDILLSDAQINNISEKIYEKLSSYIKESNALNESFNNIFNECSELKISDILSENSRNDIIEEIDKNMKNNLGDIFYDKDNFYKYLNILKFQDIFTDVLNKLKDCTLSDIAQKEEGINFIKNILNILNKDNVKELLKAIINIVIKCSSELENISLYDILPEDSDTKIAGFLNENIKNISPYFSEYIESREDLIQNLVEESIDEGMAGYDSSIKNLVIGKVRNILFSDSDNNAAQRLIDFIENYNMSEDTLDSIKNKIRELISSVKLGDILCECNTDVLFNDDKLNFDILSEFAWNYLSNKKISGILNKYDDSVLYNAFVKFFKNTVYDEKSSIIDKIINNLIKYTNVKINIIFDLKLNSLNVIEKIKNNINNNISDLLIKNKESIKNELNTQIMSLRNIDIVSSIDMVSAQNDYLALIMKAYDSFIESYSKKSLKDVMLGICNNERFKKYASIVVYDYINKNIDNILKGKIRRIVYDNLIKFNEDEICDLAIKFMGNELKPLSMFGGILGFIAGLIFGFFNSNINTYGFYNSVFSGAMACVLTAFIGIITNVIAIKMLFYPYKRNKFLSKIPFLKHFSLGYIPAHRESLANSIGKVIEEELLNGDKVKEIIKSQQEVLCAGIVNKFDEDNYRGLVNIISKNEDNISEISYNSMCTYIENNKTNINENIYSYIKDTKVCDFIKNDDLISIAQKFEKHLKSLKNSFKTKFLKSDKTIYFNNLYENMQNEIKQSIDEYLKKNENNIICEETIKNFVFSKNDIYNEFLNKNVNNLIKNEYTEKTSTFIITSINSIFKNNIGEIIDVCANHYLKNEIQPQNKLGDVFNNYCSVKYNENSQSITNNLLNALSSYLIQNKESVCDTVNSMVNSSLNFFEKAMFMMAGGSSIVNNCVEIAIVNKLPLFFAQNKEDINEVLNKAVNEVILTKDIENLHINIEECNIKNAALEMQYVLNNNMQYLSEVYNLGNSIKDELMNASICEYIYELKLGDTKQVYLRFESLIDYVRDSINKNITSNSEEVLKAAVKMFANTKVFGEEKDIINKIDFDYMFDTVCTKVSENEEFNRNCSKIILNALECMAGENTSYYLSKEVLCQDITLCIDDLIHNDKFKNEIISQLHFIINKGVVHDFDFIDVNTKAYLCSYLSERAVKSLLINMSAMLKNVKLKDVTVKEISNMKPSEIHNLFESFAGDFFKKLYIYGAFGFIFGINLYAAMVIFAYDEIINKEEK